VGVALPPFPIDTPKTSCEVVEVVVVAKLVQLERAQGAKLWLIPTSTKRGLLVEQIMGSTPTSTTPYGESPIKKPSSWGGSRTCTTTRLPPNPQPYVHRGKQNE
jgi:hypothetical protein